MSADFDALDLDTQEAYKRNERPLLLDFLVALADRDEAEIYRRGVMEAEQKLLASADRYDSDN